MARRPKHNHPHQPEKIYLEAQQLLAIHPSTPPADLAATCASITPVGSPVSLSFTAPCQGQGCPVNNHTPPGRDGMTQRNLQSLFGVKPCPSFKRHTWCANSCWNSARGRDWTPSLQGSKGCLHGLKAAWVARGRDSWRAWESHCHSSCLPVVEGFHPNRAFSSLN